MSAATIPCVLYAAKSTEDVHGSIPTQLADCRATVARDGGRVVIGEFTDEAASAYRGNRGPGLAAAKDAAVAAAAEHGTAELWVQHSDRIARGAGDAADAPDHLVEVWFAMRRRGVRLRSVQDDSNLDDPVRAVLIGERNTEDSRRKSEATRAGKRRRFDAGLAVGGPVNDGYRLVDALDADGRPVIERDGRVRRHREIDPERAPLIRRIFDMLEVGNTPGEVARALNAEGHRTQRDRPWRARTVRDLARMAFYAGYVVRLDERGQEVERREGGHEPMIDRERWERIVGSLRTNGRRGERRPSRRVDDSYILRGLAHCGECGEPLYVSPRASNAKARKGEYDRGYRCAQARQNMGTCRARWIPAGLAEQRVLRHLHKFTGDIGAWLVERAKARAEHAEDLKGTAVRAREQLAKIERRRTAVADEWERLVADGAGPKADAVLDRLVVLREEVARQQRIVDEAQTAADEHLDAPPDVDAALDIYNDLARMVAGELGSADTVEDVTLALRRVLDRVDLTYARDGGFRAEFLLQRDAVPIPGGAQRPSFAWSEPATNPVDPPLWLAQALEAASGADDAPRSQTLV